MQQYTVSKVSLASPSSSITEEYIPLWVYSSSTAFTASTTPFFLQKGTTSLSTTTAPSATKLHTLSSNWKASQKFAFEASINASTANIIVNLYDVTAGANVAGSQLTTSSIPFIVLRSATFNLVPGHIYTASIQSSAGYNCFITKAHLVAIGG